MAEARAVAAVVGEEITADFAAPDTSWLGLPRAFETTSVAARVQIRVAAGILSRRHGLNGRAALDLLRAIAFANGWDAETAADLIAAGRLDI